MADRFFEMGQVFIANGTGVITEVGRQPATITLHVTTQGTFTFTMANGTTAVVSSGTAAVTGTPQTLSAGANTVVVVGTGTITLTLTTLNTTANTNDVNSWSATDGGAVGASIPTSSDNFYATANAFTNTGQTCNVNATLSCLNMDWTNATNTPTLAFGAQIIFFYGDVTFILAMSTTGTGVLGKGGVGVSTLRTNGLVINADVGMNAGGTVTQLDNLTCRAWYPERGTWNTGNFSVSCLAIPLTSGAGGTLSLGSSVINCTSISNTGSGLTITANTATINISGTGAFAGGGLNYNGATFNLNGTAHTISGNNTFAALNFNPAGVQTITATGTTQTVGAMTRTGTGVITIVNGTFVKTGGGYVKLYKMSISGSTASPARTFYAGSDSTDGGGNTGWVFGNLPAGIIPKLMAAGAI